MKAGERFTMRRVRHVFGIAIGALIFAGVTTVTQAQTAKRGPQAKAKTERSVPLPRRPARAAKRDPRHVQPPRQRARQARPPVAPQYRLVRIAGRVVREE